MRVLVAATLILTFPLIATAQPPGKGGVKTVTGSVEVTNFPTVQDVNVVGGGTSAAARFQIVGFTIATYTGNLGGYFGATRKCQLEFPESRMCNALEVRESTTLPGGLSGLAWVDSGCRDWTVENFTGPQVSGETGVTTAGQNCQFPQPIACCAPVP